MRDDCEFACSDSNVTCQAVLAKWYSRSKA